MILQGDAVKGPFTTKNIKKQVTKIQFIKKTLITLVEIFCKQSNATVCEFVLVVTSTFVCIRF